MFISLEHRHAKLVVDTGHGMTILSYQLYGQELIVFDQLRKAGCLTYGIPILFPTPNLVAGGNFLFEGVTYAGYHHGMTRLLPFVVANKTRNSVTGYQIFEKGNVPYENFPFSLKLSITITLDNDGVAWFYQVESHDAKDIPFGIAIHPFFRRTSDAMFWTNAPYHMESDEKDGPTGKLQPASMETPMAVDDKQLDDVYFHPTAKANSGIRIYGHPFIITGSNEFHHVVIYTPRHKDFFCVEPQSCANNAINFHNRYPDLSGLQIVKPGECNSGWMRIISS
jgi:aldose 1-epimerase